MMTFNFHGMTFEVSEDSFEGRFAIASNKVDAYVQAVNKGVAYEALPVAPWDEVHALLDETFENKEHAEMRPQVWELDGTLEHFESKAYRARYMGEFLAHFKNGVPEGDLSFLSDWHKDLFGYRPRGDRWAVLVELAQAREE